MVLVGILSKNVLAIPNKEEQLLQSISEGQGAVSKKQQSQLFAKDGQSNPVTNWTGVD